MSSSGLLSLVVRIATILDELRIEYALGGSVASSFFGEPRTTADVDIAIMVGTENAERLVGRLHAELYVPESSARAAISARESFNVLEVEEGLKADLFVLGDGVLDRKQIERRLLISVPGVESNFWVTSPEDQVLRKLDWYRQGGAVSDRQWRDVLGLVTICGDALDVDYLLEIASEVGLSSLIKQALTEANGAS